MSLQHLDDEEKQLHKRLKFITQVKKEIIEKEMMKSIHNESFISNQLKEKQQLINLFKKLDSENNNEIKFFIIDLKFEIKKLVDQYTYLYSNEYGIITSINFSDKQSLFNNLKLNVSDNFFKEDGGLYDFKKYFLKELQFIEIIVYLIRNENSQVSVKINFI